ncbi:MAG: 2-phosphosulfolactate phosphatase [Bacillota bacterium]
MRDALLLDVTFTADELSALDLSETVVVVVDILRATTTITAALGAGALGVWAVTSPEAARQLGVSRAAITAGERDGRQIPGLDLGNSPIEHSGALVAGRHVALTTSNGTRTIVLARDASEILLGCFNNLGALVDVLEKIRATKVLVACAGTSGGRRITPEDVLFAGELVRGLRRSYRDLGGGAQLARDYARARAQNLEDVLRESPAGRRLMDLGYESDLDWAARRDSTGIVPGVFREEVPGAAPFLIPRGSGRPCPS